MYTKCLSTLKCWGWAYGCILIAVLLVLCTDSLPPPWPVSANTNRNFLWYSVFRYRYYCGYFWLYDLAGTPFEDFAGTLFLKIWREFLFPSKGGQSVQKGAEAPPLPLGKGGPKPPPFLWEKGAPANFKIPNLPTEFPFGIVFGMKIPRKYQRVHTGIPNLYSSTSYIGRWGWILGKMGYGWACMMLRCHGWGCKPPLAAFHIHIGCIQSVLAAWDAVDGHMGTSLCL